MTIRKYLSRLRSVIIVDVTNPITMSFDTSCHSSHANFGYTEKTVDIVNINHSNTIVMFARSRTGAKTPDRFIKAPTITEIAASFATGKVWPKDHTQN